MERTPMDASATVLRGDAAPAGGFAQRPSRGDAVRTLAAGELLGPGGLLRIDLDGEIYTLRLTRNRRLILTK
jgi:hemin uptake protein HemP